MPGRVKSWAWQHFAGSGLNWKCNSCSAVLTSGSATRLVEHLSRCEKVDDDVKLRAEKEADSARPAKRPAPQEGTKKPRQVQQTMLGVVDRVGKEEEEKIWEAWCDLFYAANIPFRAVEHPLFLKALKRTRPSLGRPPTRKDLGGARLDDSFDRHMAPVFKAVKDAPYVTLHQDAWKTAGKEHLLSVSCCTGKNTFLLYSSVLACLAFPALSIIIIPFAFLLLTGLGPWGGGGIRRVSITVCTHAHTGTYTHDGVHFAQLWWKKELRYVFFLRLLHTFAFPDLKTAN
eukprot:Sspe_Gene.15862::Locus_5537_Transcript_1_1_Confidence_1.000_Length_981::g.15862::m.15862